MICIEQNSVLSIIWMRKGINNVEKNKEKNKKNIDKNASEGKTVFRECKA